MLQECYKFETLPEFRISGEFAFLSGNSAHFELVEVVGVEKNAAGARAVQVAQNKTMLVTVYADGSAWLVPNKQNMRERLRLEGVERATGVYCVENVFLLVEGNSSVL